jgi:hypothetical protein
MSARRSLEPAIFVFSEIWLLSMIPLLSYAVLYKSNCCISSEAYF